MHKFLRKLWTNDILYIIKLKNKKQNCIVTFCLIAEAFMSITKKPHIEIYINKHPLQFSFFFTNKWFTVKGEFLIKGINVVYLKNKTIHCFTVKVYQGKRNSHANNKKKTCKMVISCFLSNLRMYIPSWFAKLK